jgi:hypothetical protein
MTSGSINLSKIKKKLNPEPDGQGLLRLQSATVSAIASDGTVDLLLNGATVTDVPVLGSARFISGQAVQVLSYRGALLVLGGSGKAVQPGPVVATGGNTDTGSTTSTSFVTALTGATNNSWGVAFIAPPSGTVLVSVKAAASNATANDYALLDFQVRQGTTINSGTVVRATNDNTAGIIRSGTAGLQATIVGSDVVTGLTPGSAYNVTLAYRASGTGAASYNRRQAIVLPQ